MSYKTFSSLNSKDKVRNAYMGTNDNQVVTHLDIRPFECYICHTAFKLKSTLKTHYAVHSSDRPFECKTCGKRFKLKHCLTLHELIHTNKNSFPCKKCGRVFKSKRGCIAHELTHSHPLKKTFICKVCGKVYPKQNYLTTHYRVHQKITLKHNKIVTIDNLGCITSENNVNQMTDTFVANGDVTQMIDTNSASIAVYSCEICKLEFINKESLRQHFWSHEMIKEYPCKKCPNIYKSLYDYTEHQHSHTYKKLNCVICCEKFNGVKDLQEHLEVHAGNLIKYLKLKKESKLEKLTK